MATTRRFWLLKTEPVTYSILDLKEEVNQTTCWDGVRNYQARNFLRDDMQVGDEVLIYHSGANPPAVVGIATVTRAGYPDCSAWDPNSDHFDPRSAPDNPRWFMVDIRLKEVFAEPITLPELRCDRKLADMELLRKGSRLSVQPVRTEEFERVRSMSARR